jgi:hypothetical protein
LGAILTRTVQRQWLKTLDPAFGAPVACIGIVLELPVVVAAVATAIVTSLVVVLHRAGLGVALGNAWRA